MSKGPEHPDELEQQLREMADEFLCLTCCNMPHHEALVRAARLGAELAADELAQAKMEAAVAKKLYAELAGHPDRMAPSHLVLNDADGYERGMAAAFEESAEWLRQFADTWGSQALVDEQTLAEFRVHAAAKQSASRKEEG